MTHEQWAKEVARILEYWYDDTCKYKIDYDNENVEICDFEFNMLNDYWYCTPNDYPNPIDACIELSKYFNISLKNIKGL